MSKDAKLARRRALRYSSVNDRTRSTTKYVIVTDHYYCCTPPARGCRHDDGCSRCDIKFYEHVVDRDLELGILPQTEYHVPLARGGRPWRPWRGVVTFSQGICGAIRFPEGKDLPAIHSVDVPWQPRQG
jgi:hypothetical protein